MVVAFSFAILKDLQKLSDVVIKVESEKSPQARKVYAAVKKFEAALNDWRLLSEAAYHAQIAAV